MKSPEAVRAALATRYRRQEWRWLRAALVSAVETTDAPDSKGSPGASEARPTDDVHGDAVAGTSGASRTAGGTSNTSDPSDPSPPDPADGSGMPNGLGDPIESRGDDDETSDWPLRLPLGAPEERRALADPDALRTWLVAWRAHDGPGTLAHATRRWRTLGRQTLPTHLILDDAAALADAVGQGARWRRLLHRGQALALASPERLAAVGTVLPTLAELDDAEWARWRDAADWLAAHPDSGLYPRQLPIAGADTKTLERWRASLERWLVGDVRSGEAIGEPTNGLPGTTGSETAGTDADTASGRLPDTPAVARDALGLRRLPTRVRTLALDPTVPGWPSGLTDTELRVDELAALPLLPTRVLVVENLQSGLALPPLPGTLAIVGRGYALETLATLRWLVDVPIDYWGDIDTHGLVMLARLRGRFEHVRSRLMDEATLLEHRALWVEETSPHAATSIDGLDEAEAALYDDLRRGRWGIGVRLEQERIAWPRALEALTTSVDDGDL